MKGFRFPMGIEITFIMSNLFLKPLRRKNKGKMSFKRTKFETFLNFTKLLRPFFSSKNSNINKWQRDRKIRERKFKVMQNVTSQYFFCCQAGRRPMEEEMRI